MSGLSIDADIAAATDLLGKSVTDLQSDVEIGEFGVTGTLKYATGYTGFSGEAAEQEGNYLVLHFEVEDEPTAVLRVRHTKGVHTDWATLDSDGILILRLEDQAQEVIVEATLGNLKATKSVSLHGLVLESEA